MKTEVHFFIVDLACKQGIQLKQQLVKAVYQTKSSGESETIVFLYPKINLFFVFYIADKLMELEKINNQAIS